MALHAYLTTNRIEPLTINGNPGYIMTVPTTQKFHALNLENSGSLGVYFTDTYRLQQEGINFPKTIRPLGRWLDIYLIEDERAPTLLLGGSAGAYTLTAGYVHPGNNDGRSTDANARDVSFLLGKGALIDWYPDKIHHEYDDYNYKKWIGKGYFGGRGCQLRWFDDDTATDTSFEQRYSVICPFARVPISN